MAAVRHPRAKGAKSAKSRAGSGASSKPKKGDDEVAMLRAQMDAAVNDYQETIRLTKLWFEAMERNPPRLKKGESVWDKIVEAGKSIPQEELDRHPPDGARNLHHYLHGHPKQDPT